MKKINFQKTINIFKQNYTQVPLEVFGSNPYKTLISTVLSARTKDEVTLKSSKKLFQIAPNIKKLSLLKEEQIAKIIYPVGFYKQKAKYLKKLSNIIETKFQSKIPQTRVQLESLPGVGRKTANLVLNRAFGVPAIAVDTHVHRISNLLGWVKTKTPEETENKLNKIVPKKYWKELNRLFVSIGRKFTSKKDLINFLKENKLIS